MPPFQGDEEQARFQEEAMKKVKEQAFYMKRAIVSGSGHFA